MAHGFKRQGKASGGGFYDYSGDAPELWSGLKTFERRSRQLDPADIRDRLLHAATLAAMGVPVSADNARVTSVFGPPVPVDEAQAAALLSATGAAFAERARDLAARFGTRFEWPGTVPDAAG